MRPPCPRTLAILVLASLLSPSCSDPSIVQETAVQTDPPRAFSQDEMQAARKLSLVTSGVGSSRVLEAASSPYARAVLCRTAIGTIGETLRQSGRPMETELRAFDQAGMAYERRLRALGAQEGKSASDIARDLEQASEDAPDLSIQAQLAITCLQNPS